MPDFAAASRDRIIEVNGLANAVFTASGPFS
jgi:hypothetical protein